MLIKLRNKSIEEHIKSKFAILLQQTGIDD